MLLSAELASELAEVTDIKAGFLLVQDAFSSVSLISVFSPSPLSQATPHAPPKTKSSPAASAIERSVPSLASIRSPISTVWSLLGHVVFSFDAPICGGSSPAPNPPPIRSFSAFEVVYLQSQISAECFFAKNPLKFQKYCARYIVAGPGFS